MTTAEVGYDVNALLKLRRKRSDTKPQLIKLGHREIEILGLSQGFWTDLYHRAMAVYPVFFGSAAAIFVALNTVFGTLYFLGRDPIANAAENGPLLTFTSRLRRWLRSAMATCTRRRTTGI
jgi:hypothetical protein